MATTTDREIASHLIGQYKQQYEVYDDVGFLFKQEFMTYPWTCFERLQIPYASEM